MSEPLELEADDQAEPAELSITMARRLELWPVERLRPYAGNARRHSLSQVEKVAGSIVRFGFLNPILVDSSTGTMVAGHCRLAAAQHLGLAEVPVVELDHLDEDDRRAYVLADNRLAELGTWDEVTLASELQALEGSLGDDGLEGLGWSGDELDALLSVPDLGEPGELEDGLEGLGEEPPPEERDPDLFYVEPPPVSVVRAGDVWRLGRHRVGCQDVFDQAARAALLDGARVAAVVTDPPYAIFGSSTGVSSDATDDRIVRPHFAAVLRIAEECLPYFGTAHVFCDWRSWAGWWDAARGTSMTCKNLLVWDKGAGGLGTNYRNSYELVGYFIRTPPQLAMVSDGQKGVRPVSASNVLHYAKAHGDERPHNAAKPVELIEELLGHVTKAGDVVLEPFLGGGSTLLAAERGGQVCIATEVEPKWVQVAIERWQRATGEQAVLEGEGWTLAEAREQRG